MPYKDINKRKEYKVTYNIDLKQHAIDSVKSGEIINQNKWNMWCKKIKSGVKNHPYTDEFTNDTIFEMMTGGCFYCGDAAMTIDRIDSTRDHTPDNCVASCWGCNCSKGAADSATFIRKAYYRARGKYIDGVVDIWFVYKNKPRIDKYKRNAEQKGVMFDLSKEEWDTLVAGNCEYCKRSPTAWFGIDRTIPSEGYVLGNVVPCCFDCNIDKHENDVETMMKRNERISCRVDAGDIVIDKCDTVIIHCGTNKFSKKIYAYGKVYESKNDASRALGKNDNYVRKCIKYGRHSNDIFEITEDFYTENV